MKNVLKVRANSNFIWECHSADLWDGTPATKKEVYAHKDGFLKRVIHLSGVPAIVPRFSTAGLKYRITEVKRGWSIGAISNLISILDGEEPSLYPISDDDTVYVTLNPTTVAIEMEKEEADSCTTVEDFVNGNCSFWEEDEQHEKQLKESEYICVYHNRQTHGVVMTVAEFLKNYAKNKIFSRLGCNTYYVDGIRTHQIVLF